MPTIESTSSVDVGKIDEDETSLNNKDKMIERRLGNYFFNDEGESTRRKGRRVGFKSRRHNEPFRQEGSTIDTKFSAWGDTVLHKII